MLSKPKTFKTSLVLLFVTVLSLCLTAGIVMAALSATRNTNFNIEVAALNATVNSGSIAVTNEVACVMRVSPKTASVPSGLTGSNFTKQLNGWYYYNSVIPAGSNTITITDVSASNIVVELMQANYSFTGSGTAAVPLGGFIMEWGYGVGTDSDNILNFSKTIDGNTLSTYSGHEYAAFYNDAGTLKEIGTKDSTATLGSNLQLVETSATSNQFKLQIKDGSTWEDASATKYLQLYNNTIQPIKAMFTLTVAAGDYTLNSSTIGSSFFPSATWTPLTKDGSIYYTNNKVILPGQYIKINDVYTGITGITGNNSVIETIGITLNISILDLTTYVTNYNTSSTEDAYLTWLGKLGGNYKTHYQNLL